MKKELFSRIFVGLLGGIVISYLITIGISLFPIVIVELQKKFTSMNLIKIIYMRKQEV